MNRLRWLIRNMEEIVCCLLLLVMVATVALAVFARFLHVSIVWTDELARYTFIWTVYLGSAVVVKRRGHIAIEFLIRLLPSKLKMVLYTLIQLMLLALFAFLCKYGYALVAQTWSVPTTSLEIPTGLVYLSVPLSGTLMIIYTLIDMWKTLVARTLPVVNEPDANEGGGV